MIPHLQDVAAREHLHENLIVGGEVALFESNEPNDGTAGRRRGIRSRGDHVMIQGARRRNSHAECKCGYGRVCYESAFAKG